MLSPTSKESKDKLSQFSFKSSSVHKKDDSSQDPNTDTKGLISSPLSLSDESSHGDHRRNQQHLDGDQLSLTSSRSIRSSKANSRLPGLERQDSLIFERMVQDPLIDSQPVPTSLPRHFASENFIPASMDTISNNDVSDITASELNEINSPRRSSTANLQAAFANSSPSSPSIYGRKHSISTSNLVRNLSSSSHSNLTSQLQSSQFQNNRPQLNHSNTYSNSIPFPQQQQQSSQSPNSPKLKQTKSSLSFYSYADMITQEDQESKYQIRRPSLSLSMSHPRLSRTSSMSSNNQLLQRSPTNNPSNSPNQGYSSHSFSFSNNPNIARIPTQNRRCSGFKSQTSPVQFSNPSALNIPSALHNLQQPKKFTLDTMSSSDSEDDSCSCSATRQSLAGLSRKSSVTVAPVRMSSGGVGVSYGSINNNNNNGNNIDDLLIDNVSSGASGKRSSDEESSLHSFHGVALKG